MGVTLFPQKTKLELEIEGLYQVLPFDERADGAIALSKEMGYKISKQRLDFLLLKVRANPKRWGFSIPQAKRGPRTSDEEGPRYIVAPDDNTLRSPLSKNENVQVRKGAISHLSSIHSTAIHQAEALKRVVPCCVDMRSKRLYGRISRDLLRVSEDTEDLREMLRDHVI